MLLLMMVMVIVTMMMVMMMIEQRNKKTVLHSGCFCGLSIIQIKLSYFKWEYFSTDLLLWSFCFPDEWTSNLHFGKKTNSTLPQQQKDQGQELTTSPKLVKHSDDQVGFSTLNLRLQEKCNLQAPEIDYSDRARPYWVSKTLLAGFFFHLLSLSRRMC